MQRIQFKDYLRSNQLHREVSLAVRYAKDTPRKTKLLRDYFAAAMAEIDTVPPVAEAATVPAKPTSKSKEIK